MQAKQTAYDKIQSWMNAPDLNAESLAITLTYEEIGLLLNISTSSVSTILPVFVAHKYKITIKAYKEKRREAARRKRRSTVKIPRKTENKLKALRRAKASYIECAAVLNLCYNTVRKYCKLLGC